MRLCLKLLPMVVALLVVLPANAARRRTILPSWFKAQATCVHQHEEHWSWKWGPRFHPHYTYWNHYYTGMQFALSTWQRANGLLHSHVQATTRNPIIIMRHAYVIVRQDGGSWREWPNSARECGLSVY